MKTRIGWSLELGIVAGLIVMFAASAMASSCYDALIVELQSRSALLGNSTDKNDAKQKKVVDKVLITLPQYSASLSTDIKNGIKVGKALAKAFPDEFTVGGTPVTNSLSILLQQAFQDLGAQVSNLVDWAQVPLDNFPASKCKQKAQQVMDQAASTLNSALESPDFRTGGKLLSRAAKNVLKGQALVASAANCGGGKGSSGKVSGTRMCDSWSFAISGEDLSNTTQTSNYEYDYSGKASRQYGAIVANNTGNTYYYDAHFVWGSLCLNSVQLTMSGGILSPSSQTVKF